MSDEKLPNILAVDDDFAVRMAMDFMFKKWPEYNLILAEDPNDALTKLDEREYMMMFICYKFIMNAYIIQNNIVFRAEGAILFQNIIG